jgi:hypothetical protein
MDRRVSWDLQFLALPTALSELHHLLFGAPPDALAPLVMQQTLNELAHSVAPLAPIFSMQAGEPKALPQEEIARGTFTGGAHAFITQSGKEYRNLVLQRSQIRIAASTFGNVALRRALKASGSTATLAAALGMELHELEDLFAGSRVLPPRTFAAALDLIAHESDKAHESLRLFLQGLTKLS